MSSEVVSQCSPDVEYRKHNGISPSDIAALRTWLKTQTHLPENYITDLDLILAYHCCERSSEVTKQVIDLNFTLRTLFTGLFSNRTIDEKIVKALSTMLITLLPTRSKEGYACLYICFLDNNPKNLNLLEVVRSLFMVMDLWQYEEGTWPGLMLVVDLEGMVFGHLSIFDFQILQQYFYFTQEAIFFKNKGLHYINAPSFMDKLLFLVKPFLKKCLLDVLYVHQTGSDTLDKFYPKDALPKEAGGTYKSVYQCRDEVLSKLKANEDFFLREGRARVNEELRPGKPRTVSDVFAGVEGTFKSLAVD